MVEPPFIRCITIVLSTMLCEFVKVDSRMMELISLTTTILVTVASGTSIGQRCFKLLAGINHYILLCSRGLKYK